MNQLLGETLLIGSMIELAVFAVVYLVAFGGR